MPLLFGPEKQGAVTSMGEASGGTDGKWQVTAVDLPEFEASLRYQHEDVRWAGGNESNNLYLWASFPLENLVIWKQKNIKTLHVVKKYVYTLQPDLCSLSFTSVDSKTMGHIIVCIYRKKSRCKRTCAVHTCVVWGLPTYVRDTECIHYPK